MLLARKPLLLRGGDDPAVGKQRSGATGLIYDYNTQAPYPASVL